MIGIQSIVLSKHQTMGLTLFPPMHCFDPKPTNQPTATVLRVCDVFDATKKDNTIATVTEMCTGQHLHASTPYPEIRVRAIVMQILDALAYMHQRGLFLNNLTTENST